eukprot:280331-Pyramimonas_sp.AAC.1
MVDDIKDAVKAVLTTRLPALTAVNMHHYRPLHTAIYTTAHHPPARPHRGVYTTIGHCTPLYIPLLTTRLPDLTAVNIHHCRPLHTAIYTTAHHPPARPHRGAYTTLRLHTALYHCTPLDPAPASAGHEPRGGGRRRGGGAGGAAKGALPGSVPPPSGGREGGHRSPPQQV